MADWVIAISYGELVLKGKNRHRFISRAERSIDKVTEQFQIKSRFSQHGKYYLEVEEAEIPDIVREVQKVFGIVYVTPAIRVAKTMEAISEGAVFMMRRRLERRTAEEKKEKLTFKVRGKRADKSFPLGSPELSAKIGGVLLSEFAGELKVDVNEPECTLFVDVREDCFIYTDRYDGMGGLPMGSGGRGLVLLSGGIDSPVAGFEMARRGLELGCIHFHSYPFTSERAKDKAERLARQMSRYVGPMRVYMVNLLETYTAIHRECRAKNTTILSRRMMMRIADKICDEYEYDCVITGESLGQVASQTVQGISVVDNASRHVILRPLIATDKNRIIEVARDIDTYEISIEPFDDCCSVFAPTRPNTKPRLHDIEADEEKLDIEALLETAMESLEVIDIE